MDMGLPVLAGLVSTTVFVGSHLPMLVKAARTRDLNSYSLGQIVLANVGNVIHTLYVLHLPWGPVWLLHGFYLVSTALMLIWYLRYNGGRHGSAPRDQRAPHWSTSPLGTRPSGGGATRGAAPDGPHAPSMR